MDTAAYLSRIGYQGTLRPDYETLRGLQAAHMYAVPFENLDIVPLHRNIELDLESLWDKIVTRRRGGFCYELNGLFAWLLQQVGFVVRYLNARVFDKQGVASIDFDHLALLVGSPGEHLNWLADVGFGDSFIDPLRLDLSGEQVQGLRAYRLELAADDMVLWQRNYDRTWEHMYTFDLKPRSFPSEYKSACWYHQRSPASSFTRRSIVSLATPEGRLTLEDRRLVATVRGQRREETLSGQSEYDQMLQSRFGIVL